MITISETPGQPANSIYTSYSSIIGYNTQISGSYGLRSLLEEELFYNTTDNKGNTIRLTTDNGLQDYCYNLLDQKGSITVLDSNTGAILALASKGEVEVDVNKIDEKLSEYNSYHETWYPSALTQGAPGSVFKIITSAAALYNNLEDIVYQDTGGYTTSSNGVYINNYAGQAHGNINLTQAFNVSSNAYFCNLGVTLGSRRLSETAEKFLIGSELKLDFTTLTSNFNIEGASETEIAQTAMGQGVTEISPLHMATIVAGINNNGELRLPYLIGSIAHYGSESMPYYFASTRGVHSSIPESDAIKELMRSCATGYEIHSDIADVGMKSGTAELGNGYNKTWLIGFYGDYSIVITHDKTSETSYALRDEFISVMEYIELHLF